MCVCVCVCVCVSSVDPHPTRAARGVGVRVHVWVCVNASTWPGTSFLGHPFLDLGLASVSEREGEDGFRWVAR